ncbi:hypothetical protein FRC09_007016 [Ceratobasidium sp. 395]|nr:hypothetical protein FRC09_007016 [Ceratobasidium sp. 395]
MNEATAVYNMTMFIIPYPKNAVEELAGYPLLPSFLNLTPAGTAPLALQFGKLADIRQSVAQIPELMSASVIIPGVDRLKNNKTSFLRTKCTFTDQAIPATVSSLIEGYQNELATFTPSHDAYGVNQGVRFYQVKQTVVPTFELFSRPAPLAGQA